MTFITFFTIPYLVNAPYAHSGGKIGFIYIFMVVVVYFVIPELKGRSLEVDEMFA